MEPPQDWQSSHFEKQLSRLDRGGLSFEFLRRNQNYHADYKMALEEIAFDKVKRDAAIARLSHRWGLEFPCRSSRFRPHHYALMATTALSRHCDCHGRAGRLCNFSAS